MSDPTFGINIQRIDNEPRPGVAANMSVIGLLCVADAANATRFPLNVPVFCYSDDSTLAADLGATSEPMDALDAINDQLGEFQVAAEVVIVRVAEGVDTDETITNMVGSSVAGTGIHAFKDAGQITGFTPRLIIAPGYTSQQSASNIANALVAEAPAVLDALLAHMICEGPGTTLQAFTDWRETISSTRIIPVETWVKVGQSATVAPSAARICGIAVRRDHEFGGRPFHSWANQPVRGIVGPNRPIRFSLTDGATEGQAILSQNGGVIVRGEMGVEQAIASAGFVFIGTDTASDDELWRFYNVSRGRDYIHLLFLQTLRFYLGKFNITVNTIDAVLRTMESSLRSLQADQDILGFQVGFDRDQNSPEEIRLGRFTVKFQAEEPPVLRYLGIQSARYRPALEAVLDDLIAQVDPING